MLKTTLLSLLILACVLVLPTVAQTPPAPAANQTMGTNPAATKTVHRKTLHAAHHGGAFDDATRLAALLADTQGKATLSPAAWKSIANEANARANKLYAATSGKNRTAAKEARTHVREMHKAAMKGDADGAKSHAAMALPYVYQIIDATAPKK
jgi:ribosomal protein S20